MRFQGKRIFVTGAAAGIGAATVELFRMAPEFGPLFSEVLTERDAVRDPEHLAAARQGVGPLPPGQWYCPIVSPMIGG